MEYGIYIEYMDANLQIENGKQIFTSSHTKTGITSLSHCAEKWGITTVIGSDIGDLATLQKLRWFCCCSENCHFHKFFNCFLAQ